MYITFEDNEPVVDTPTDRADENETRLCADCLGCGRFGGRACIYCRGAGRMPTYRALVLRQQRAERMAQAAPALYEAVKELIGVEYRHGSLAKREAEFLAAIERGRAALALADGNQETK